MNTLFQKNKTLPFFPSLSIHTDFDFGQTRVTERKCFLRKVFSSEESIIVVFFILVQCFQEDVSGRIAKFDRNSRTSFGHVQKVAYIAALTV